MIHGNHYAHGVLQLDRENSIEGITEDRVSTVLFVKE